MRFVCWGALKEPGMDEYARLLIDDIIEYIK